jgi:hypothetical protein
MQAQTKLNNFMVEVGTTKTGDKNTQSNRQSSASQIPVILEQQSSERNDRTDHRISTKTPKRPWEQASQSQLHNDSRKSLFWDRARYNHRSKCAASLLDHRWAAIRFVHFARMTYFNVYTGPVTPVEACVAIASLALPLAFTVLSSVPISGQITQYLIFFSVLVSLRKNILQLVLGISWERAILFHKMFGIAALVVGIVHGIPRLAPHSAQFILHDHILLSGLLSLVLVALQPLVYFACKHRSFEVFYLSHLAAYAGLVYFAYKHSGVVLYSCLLFVLDLTLRWLFVSRRVDIKVELVITPNAVPSSVNCAGSSSNSTIKVTFDKKWPYRTGQYLFLLLPAGTATALEWHPFTIASAPHELETTLYIAPLGNWTNALAQQAADGPVILPAFVDGPYGLPAVDLEDDTYKIVMLISGGIGVTPHLSMAKSLLHAHSQGRPLKKIIHVWTLRHAMLSFARAVVPADQIQATSYYEENEVEELWLQREGDGAGAGEETAAGATTQAAVVVETQRATKHEEAALYRETIGDLEGGEGCASYGQQQQQQQQVCSTELYCTNYRRDLDYALHLQQQQQQQEHQLRSVSLSVALSGTPPAVSVPRVAPAGTDFRGGSSSSSCCNDMYASSATAAWESTPETGAQYSMTANFAREALRKSQHPAQAAVFETGATVNADDDNITTAVDTDKHAPKKPTATSTVHLDGSVALEDIQNEHVGVLKTVPGVPASLAQSEERLQLPIFPHRPDFKELFERLHLLAVEHDETRVAVSVCGPASFVESVINACREHSVLHLSSAAPVQFDLHVEVFDL